MATEILVALQVTDNELYDRYRAEMYPILQEYGGSFGYDFKVAEVLKSETPEPLNRVFTIRFQNKDNIDAFFKNAEYLAIKKLYFTPAVTTVVEIANYEK